MITSTKCITISIIILIVYHVNASFYEIYADEIRGNEVNGYARLKAPQDGYWEDEFSQALRQDINIRINHRNFFRPINTKSDTDEFGITEQYFGRLNGKLVKEGLQYVNFYGDEHDYLPEGSRVALYNGQLRDIEFIKRSIVVNSAWGSAVDVVGSTELGRQIKHFERKVLNFLFMEYSRSMVDNSAEFYWSKDNSAKDEIKEYEMTFSPFVRPDNDTLDLDLSFNFGLKYYTLSTMSSYFVFEERKELLVTDEWLNKLIGINTGYFYTGYSNGETRHALSWWVYF